MGVQSVCLGSSCFFLSFLAKHNGLFVAVLAGSPHTPHRVMLSVRYESKCNYIHTQSNLARGNSWGTPILFKRSHKLIRGQERHAELTRFWWSHIAWGANQSRSPRQHAACFHPKGFQQVMGNLQGDIGGHLLYVGSCLWRTEAEEGEARGGSARARYKPEGGDVLSGRWVPQLVMIRRPTDSHMHVVNIGFDNLNFISSLIRLIVDWFHKFNFARFCMEKQLVSLSRFWC